MDAQEREEAKKSSAPTTTAAWKRTTGGQPLEVPSGNTALIRRRSLSVFVKTGRVPNSLVEVVKEAITGGKKFDSKKLEWDQDQLLDLMAFQDAVVIEATVEPKVHAVPECNECEGKGFLQQPGSERVKCSACEGTGEGERDDDLLYVDDVDFDDKVFIFNYAVAGETDLDKFRQQPDGDVDALSGGEGVSDEAVEVAGVGGPV